MYIAQPGIVLLIGASSSGKSAWLQARVADGTILPTEIVSSDTFRTYVSDTDYVDTTHDIEKARYQTLSAEAFALMHAAVEARCRLNRTTFIDATNLYASDRKVYFDIARKHHMPVYGIYVTMPLASLLAYDETRDKPRGHARLKQHTKKIAEQKPLLKKEPFKKLYTVQSLQELTLTRADSPLLLQADSGLDILGDIHGCYDEMLTLLTKLGYSEANGLYTHLEGRKLLSLGDIMSRGPKSLKTMQFWQRHIEAGLAYMIDSNHGYKIARYLSGQHVTLRHGDELIAEELMQYESLHGSAQTTALKQSLADMLLKAPSHYVLTVEGLPQAVVVHAGIRDHYIGKQSRRIQDFCRYGDVTDVDDNGRPIRADWYTKHRTPHLIIWGHDPHIAPYEMNRTINIDQGAVFGGALTALRYPEQQIVQVEAQQDYAQDADNPLVTKRAKRFDAPSLDELLHLTVETATDSISIPEAQAKAALDVFSHYTLPLEQIVYIPPTMSPPAKTSKLADFLEHPQEVFDYYRERGITTLIAQKKHMGSRAVLLLFKSTAEAKMHIDAEVLGVITTRTGRAFFTPEQEAIVLTRLHDELTAKGYFEAHKTDFVLMDAEILPWNLKAQSLIDAQYTHVAENALFNRQKLVQKLALNEQSAQWQADYSERMKNAVRFDAAYQNFIWDPGSDIENIQIAPFQLLAHSQETLYNRPHDWHMAQAQKLAAHSSFFIATDYKTIKTPEDEQAVIDWWLEMTTEGHEGIVVKPMTPTTLVQPAMKVRGREYLRLIYGMDYTEPAQLAKLKKRNVQKKMRHAMQEYVLGLEGINRFVQQQSTARIHACVFATLALESDPVDPRL